MEEKVDVEIGSSSKSKKYMVLVLQWFLVLATSYLLLFSSSGNDSSSHYQHFVIGFILLTIALSFLPDNTFSRSYFDHFLILGDIAFISAALWLTGLANSDFFLLYFFVVMIAAVSETIMSLVISTFIVSCVYVGLQYSINGAEVITDYTLYLRVALLYVLSIFVGYFAQRMRIESKKAELFQTKLSTAKTLRQISDAFAISIEEDQILNQLVEAEYSFCNSKGVAVISRSSSEVLIEKGDTTALQSKKLLHFVLSKLQSKIQAKEGSSASDENSVRKNIEPIILEQYNLFPIGSDYNADLYLCVIGEIHGDLLEYAQIIISSASQAMMRARNYEELLFEAEKRKQLIDELTEALTFKTQFLANFSHEIRTPINSSIGFCDLLLEGAYGELEKEQLKVVNRIIINSRTLLELVNNILDFSKLEAGEITPTPKLNYLQKFVTEIAATCEPLLSEKDVVIELDVDKNLPQLFLDWRIFRQIAVNLVSNAAKFTEKGIIRIAAEYDFNNGLINFSVRDTGIGIEPEDAKNIFRPFRQIDHGYSRKYSGTGLGLAITKRHVEMLGGKISVRSKPGKGSEFLVMLPVFSQKAEENEQAMETLA